MPRVAITDYTFDSLDIEEGILRAAGCTVQSGQCKTAETLIPLVAEVDAVITQFAPVKADVIAAMRRARVIVRYGIGVDNIDLEAARQAGIPVCNVPDYCIDEVADHTLALLLGMTRQVVPNSQAVKAGQWRLTVPMEAMKTLRDLTVGIVGCGRIGREVLRRLVPFKCRLLAFDPVVPGPEIAACGATPVSFAQLVAESDVISLHCPSTAQTRRMINRDVFRRMKPGALLVNVARGDLVDTAALVEALESGRLGGAALDVFDPEPIPADHPVPRRERDVILSAHLASVSPRAVRTLRETAAELAARVLRGEPPINVVNGVLRS
jgi:D-3-phosphoglycerate dehydrogenase